MLGVVGFVAVAWYFGVFDLVIVGLAGYVCDVWVLLSYDVCLLVGVGVGLWLWQLFVLFDVVCLCIWLIVLGFILLL